MNLNIGAILFLVFMLQSAGGGAANSQQLTKILMFLGFMYFAFKTLLPMLFDVLLAYTQQSPTKVMEITLPVSEYEYLIKNQQTMLLEDDGEDEDEDEEEVETKLATDIQTALDTALRSIPGLQIISSDVVFPGDSKSATVMLKKTKKPLVASSPAPLPVPSSLPVPAPIVVVQPVPAVAPSPIVVAQPAPIVAPAPIVVAQPTTAPVLIQPVV